MAISIPYPCRPVKRGYILAVTEILLNSKTVLNLVYITHLNTIFTNDLIFYESALLILLIPPQFSSACIWVRRVILLSRDRIYFMIIFFITTDR